MKRNLLAAALAATFVSAWAQSESWFRPQFEKVSIRASKLDTPSTFAAGNGTGGGTNVTLKTLIAFAYGLQPYQILDGPGWISSDRFDIEATAADPKTPSDRLRVMLQFLFADRFKLAVHRETKLSNVYVLVVAPGGPRIGLAADQTSPDLDGPSLPGAGPGHGAIRVGAGSMIGNAVPLSRFANLLSQRLDRTVIDKTKLTGRFDIRLQWTPDVGENSPGEVPAILVAIQEQLGLKLKPGKELVEFLIVDRVEKPSEK
jgi:uncharacterized protein (TIGR03435 family)